MASERKCYAFRLYLSGDLFKEFKFFSLKTIYIKTMQYKNFEELRDSILKKLNIRNDEFLTFEIVYYPNKEENKYKPLNFVPYEKDKLLFDRDYLDKKFESFSTNPDFAFDFVDMLCGEDSPVGMKKMTYNVKADFDSANCNYTNSIRRLYEAAMDGLKWRTHTYLLIQEYAARQSEMRNANQSKVEEAIQREKAKIDASIDEWYGPRK